MSKQLFEQLKEKEMSKETMWDLHESPQEIKPIELSGEVSPEIFGIEPVKAQEMVSGLSTIFAEREVLKNAFIDVIELEINSENLPIFKELRLKIVKNRTQGVEKWHKTNKAFYLAGGRFVDAIKNKEILENEQMEAKLMDAEKFFENQEKEVKRVLNEKRIEIIRPYVDDVAGLDFSDFSDENFDDFVLGKKTRFEAKVEAEKQEAIRIENEQKKQKLIQENKNELLPWKLFIENFDDIDFENVDLISVLDLAKCKKAEAEQKAKAQEIENARLQKEADDAKAKADQLEAENKAKLEVQRKENARIAKELQDKKDAEIKTENERLAKIEAEKLATEKLAKAGVKVQLDTWVDAFNIEIPTHLKNNEIANEILTKFWQFKSWAKKQSDV